MFHHISRTHKGVNPLLTPDMHGTDKSRPILSSNIDHQLSQLDKSVRDTGSHIGPKIDSLHNDLREHHSNLFNALPDTFQQGTFNSCIVFTERIFTNHAFTLSSS